MKYSSVIRDADLYNGFISKPVEHERRVLRVFATDRIGSSSIKKDRFLLACGIGKDSGGL